MIFIKKFFNFFIKFDWSKIQSTGMLAVLTFLFVYYFSVNFGISMVECKPFVQNLRLFNPTQMNGIWVFTHNVNKQETLDAISFVLKNLKNSELIIGHLEDANSIFSHPFMSIETTEKLYNNVRLAVQFSSQSEFLIPNINAIVEHEFLSSHNLKGNEIKQHLFKGPHAWKSDELWFTKEYKNSMDFANLDKNKLSFENQELIKDALEKNFSIITGKNINYNPYFTFFKK